MANINLLPWRERLREERKQEFFVYIGISAALAVGVIGAVHFYFMSAIDNQNAINNYYREQIAVLDQKLVEIRQLQEQKEALTARMTVIQQLQGNRPVIVRLFDELVRTLPENVYFNSIKRTNDSIAIEGVAENNNRISELMRNLDQSEWFSGAEFKQTTALGGTTEIGAQQANANNLFQLTVKVTTPVTKEN